MGMVDRFKRGININLNLGGDDDREPPQSDWWRWRRWHRWRDRGGRGHYRDWHDDDDRGGPPPGRGWRR